MVENTVALNSSINIFLLLFKFNYQSCLSQLASGNFNWKISVTMLKLGYISNFGLISQYFNNLYQWSLFFGWDFCEKLVYSKYSTRLLRWYDRIFFFYVKIVFDFIEPFHLPLKPFLRKSKSRSDAYFSHGDQPFSATKITNSILLIK